MPERVPLSLPEKKVISPFKLEDSSRQATHASIRAKGGGTCANESTSYLHAKDRQMLDVLTLFGDRMDDLDIGDQLVFSGLIAHYALRHNGHVPTIGKFLHLWTVQRLEDDPVFLERLSMKTLGDDENLQQVVAKEVVDSACIIHQQAAAEIGSGVVSYLVNQQHLRIASARLN